MDYKNTNWLLDFPETGAILILSTNELVLVFADYFKFEQSNKERKQIWKAIKECRMQTPTTTWT